ncbi:MAG: phosphate transport system regulatory protein PhoU [Lentisphaerae bacterium GWF2_45_14]|nr:MAG: phosphate transport system regulatory protein PhoU [Lentisphaerae bacterium GWF2_45_14]
MPIHLSKEINKLKKSILALCTTVEENVRKAVTSVVNKDIKLAIEVEEKDIEIDQMEIDIEEECLKILALHQPVAIDLRYVIACMKMNNDLERIGDLAENIARSAKAIAEFGDDDEQRKPDFSLMMDKTRSMLKKTLDSLIEMDTNLAREVIKEDDVIDDLNREMHTTILRWLKENPAKAEYYVRLLNVSKHLERIADYATNIAEDVLYMATGSIVRHQVK